MNELEFLRSQVRLERTHMRDVRAALGDALRRSPAPPGLDASAQAAARYLVFVLRRFVMQDRMHCSQLATRVGAAQGLEAAERARIDGALRDLAMALDDVATATDALAGALDARQRGAMEPQEWLEACAAFDRFYEAHLVQRRHQLSLWLESYYDIADWRRSSCVDAESVFEERRLHEEALRALAALPSP